MYCSDFHIYAEYLCLSTLGICDQFVATRILSLKSGQDIASYTYDIIQTNKPIFVSSNLKKLVDRYIIDNILRIKSTELVLEDLNKVF